MLPLPYPKAEKVGLALFFAEDLSRNYAPAQRTSNGSPRSARLHAVRDMPFSDYHSREKPQISAGIRF
jgi:hypothetical protein